MSTSKRPKVNKNRISRTGSRLSSGDQKGFQALERAYERPKKVYKNEFNNNTLESINQSTTIIQTFIALKAFKPSSLIQDAVQLHLGLPMEI